MAPALAVEISEKVKISVFSFNEVTIEEVEKCLKDLDPRKTSTFNNTPPKLVKILPLLIIYHLSL